MTKNMKWLVVSAVLALDVFALAACISGGAKESSVQAEAPAPVKVACENGVMLGKTADGVVSFKGKNICPDCLEKIKAGF